MSGRLPSALHRLALMAAAALWTGSAVLAQDAVPAPGETPAVLILDQQRLFEQSAWGRAAIARAETEAQALSEENLRIEEALRAEEQSLTDRRATTPAEEFARLAGEFDTRVEGIRKAQDIKLTDIRSRVETEQKRFLAAARPVLEAMLQQSGATAILASGAVLYANHDTDITDTAIARMDAAFPGLPPEAP